MVFTPKSLLRHPKAVSTFEELSSGSFREVINDTGIDPSRVTRVVFCSGKVYYDLLAAREKKNATHIALVRVEQMYPFPEQQINDVLMRYPLTAEIAWVQEEPLNMGAWRFMSDWFAPLLAPTRRKTPVHRPRRKRQSGHRFQEASRPGAGRPGQHRTHSPDSVGKTSADAIDQPSKRGDYRVSPSRSSRSNLRGVQISMVCVWADNPNFLATTFEQHVPFGENMLRPLGRRDDFDGEVRRASNKVSCRRPQATRCSRTRHRVASSFAFRRYFIALLDENFPAP